MIKINIDGSIIYRKIKNIILYILLSYFKEQNNYQL